MFLIKITIIKSLLNLILEIIVKILAKKPRKLKKLQNLKKLSKNKNLYKNNLIKIRKNFLDPILK